MGEGAAPRSLFGGTAIDWQLPYIVSRSLTLEISHQGTLVGSSSISRPTQALDLDALPVLLAFASGATPEVALNNLQEELALDKAAFEVTVETLLEHNFLTPLSSAGADPSLAAEGFASLLAQHQMLRDPVRVMAYRAAITRHCRDKVVAEIGCGSGILSIFAAQAGARRVIAIEESGIADLARRMFEANGYEDVIDLRLGNSRDVEIDEPVDVILHEIFGTDPLIENLLPFIDDARRRLLRPGGRLLPERLEVCCMGLELEHEPTDDKPRYLAEAGEFGGLYGVDFSPYLEMLGKSEARRFRPSMDDDEGPFGHRVLSAEHKLLDIDLHDIDATLDADRIELPLCIRDAGSLAALVLYFRAHLDSRSQLTTSPFGPRTHWGWDVRPVARRQPVTAGDEVMLAVEIESWLGRQRLKVDLAG